MDEKNVKPNLEISFHDHKVKKYNLIIQIN